jgi:hypothetical protein
MEFYLKILEVIKVNFLKPLYIAGLENILKFVTENTKRAQLPAKQFLLVIVDINIYCRISYWMISNSNLRLSHPSPPSVPIQDLLWGKGGHSRARPKL